MELLDQPPNPRSIEEIYFSPTGVITMIKIGTLNYRAFTPQGAKLSFFINLKYPHNMNPKK